MPPDRRYYSHRDGRGRRIKRPSAGRKTDSGCVVTIGAAVASAVSIYATLKGVA